MPPITLMTENRKVMVKARVRQCKGDVKTLYRVIDIAMASDFMNGNNKHGWLGKFDWIFGNEQNFAKVLEGNFKTSQPQASSRNRQQSRRRILRQRQDRASGNSTSKPSTSSQRASRIKTTSSGG